MNKKQPDLTKSGIFYSADSSTLTSGSVSISSKLSKVIFIWQFANYIFKGVPFLSKIML